MENTHMKKLYLASSLEELNKKVSAGIDKKVSAKMLVKSAGKILNQAEHAVKLKDEELAYLYYMRYFSIIQCIQLQDEYKNNKKYYNGLLKISVTIDVIAKAEELNKSLERRYGLRSTADLAEKEEKERETAEIEKELDEKKNSEKKKSVLAALDRKDVMDGFLSCHKLKTLMNEKSSSFIIIDVRPAEHFQSSSIKVSSLINVSEDILQRGLTANRIGNHLDQQSRLLWERRNLYDYIVICDETTDKSPFPSPIVSLMEAMQKWDPGKVYRATPVVLDGGFDLFRLMFPMLTTNPSFEPLSFKSLSIGSSNVNDSSPMLNFNFPDLNDGFISTPSPEKEESPSVGGLSGTPLQPPTFSRELKPKLFNFGEGPKHNIPNAQQESKLADEVSSRTTDDINYGLTETSASDVKEPVGSWVSIDNSLPNGVPASSGSPFSVRRESSGKPVPVVPSRSLKPNELLENFKAKEEDLEEEQKLIEQTYEAEQETIKKLEEVVAAHKAQQNSSDEQIRMEFAETEVRLKREIDKLNIQSQDRESKYNAIAKQNDELRNLIKYFLSNQMSNLKISDASSSSLQSWKEEDSDVKELEAANARDEKRKKMLTGLDELRKLKNEKLDAITKTEDKERKEQMKWAAERNSRNRENLKPDSLSAKKSTPTKSRNGETYTTRLRSSPKSSPVRGSNMKRSHSALNLSQLTEDEGLSPRPNPSFDRSLKPLETPRRRNINAARQRNFEPKYGSVGPTNSGLKNLGNTCYMNSIIQCLNNTFILAKYFFDGSYSDDLNPKSDRQGEVAEEVAAVVRALWCGQYRSIAMWDLKAVIGRCHKLFLGYDQHDAHEFLLKLLDWLHNDLNLVTVKLPKMKEQNHSNLNDSEAARNVIECLKMRDNSIIRTIFYGLHRSVIVCETCSNRSLTFEPFSVLTLSFPANGRCTLKDMLHDYYKESSLEFKCERCRVERNCIHKFDIWKLPKILIIHFNRFEHDVLTKKKQNFVDFPLENLDLSHYVSTISESSRYSLYGVSNHYGTIDGGHYTAYCKSPVSKIWHKFDDHEVYDLSREAVKTAAAYILFYEKVQ